MKKRVMEKRNEDNITSKSDGPPPAKKRAKKPVCDLPIPEIPKKIGYILACGQGDMGQLGLGEDIMERKRPGIVDFSNIIVNICAGGMHSLCLTSTGKVYSFGCNDEGALGRDTSKEGSEFLPDEIDLPGKCVKISAGDSHSACLLSDGRVFAFGSFRDSHGNMGLTLEGNKRFPVEVALGSKSCDIASGADHLVILTCTGIVYTMGCAEQGQLGRVSLRSAGGESRRGKTELLTPGPVYMAGKKFEAIWATTYCTFVKEFNTSKIFAFGLNNYSQLTFTDKSSVPRSRPTLTKLDSVKKISGGQHHTLVLNDRNECYAIGRKEYGRLGIGNLSEDIEELQAIPTLSKKAISEISCGETQSFAVTVNGEVYAWGMGSNLQLGTGNEDDEFLPVLIKSQQTENKKILKVASGGQHTIFLVEAENNKKTKVNAEKAKMNGGVKKPQLTDNVDDKEMDDNNSSSQSDKEDVDDIPVNGTVKNIQSKEVTSSKPLKKLTKNK